MQVRAGISWSFESQGDAENAFPFQEFISKNKPRGWCLYQPAT